MRRQLYSTILLVAGALAGAYVSTLESNDTNDGLAPMRAQRNPASIRKNFDFSQLDGSALEYASKQRLVTGAKVLQEADQIGIELGHFVVRNGLGQKEFACQRYKHVTMSFEAEVVDNVSEKPKMEIEGSCEISANVNSISPIWVPVAKIMSEVPGDGEFTFRERTPMTVRFSGVAGNWPKKWVLKSVKLVDETSSVIAIETKELESLVAKPITLSF